VGGESSHPQSELDEYYDAVAPVLLPHLQGRSVDRDGVEVRVPLALAEDVERPTHMVFELDADVALVLRGMFEQLGLKSFVKTTGAGGLHVYVPLNSDVTYEQTRPFARQVAELLEQQLPGKVLVDWSLNDAAASIIAPYSLRAGKRPRVSTPVTWQEVEAGELDFDPTDVVKRVDKHGDLFAPVLTLVQQLPG
jgi:bifunctional non-homologous end joining protein LigD